ncbi:MAG: protein kinase, partial [Myxococcales bacterium]|nr:protein kinase [Myxococcales bacterium]
MDSAQSPATANAAPRPSPPKEATAIKQGDKVGNRFVIDERLGDGVFGTTYRAVDEKSGKKIAILMMDPALAADKASTDALRTSVKLATELVHKNVLGVFGMGKEGARRYVAYEYVDGQTLSELLDKKAEAGKQFTLKGAYNLMAHVCNGLQYAREKMSHDTLRPSVVLINRTGRVKVADFGFAALRPALLGAGTALGQWDLACLDDGSSPIDGLHALGIMIYALLV